MKNWMNFSALSCSFQSIFFNFLIKTTSQGKGRNVLHAKVSIKIMANKLFLHTRKLFLPRTYAEPINFAVKWHAKEWCSCYRGDFLRKHAGKKREQIATYKNVLHTEKKKLMSVYHIRVWNPALIFRLRTVQLAILT